MGWSDLLEQAKESVILPWLGGGRSLHSRSQRWTIDGGLPREHGWYKFQLHGRKVTVTGRCEPQPEILIDTAKGYLVGDRIVPDGIRVDPDPRAIRLYSEPVFLIEEGLDRFVRVTAGRVYPEGPLVYKEQDFPEGPEEDVLEAFLDQKSSVNDIKGVNPALDAAFRMETWQREEAERRRQELLQRQQEEEERRQLEERRRKIQETLGDGAARREFAKKDFREAAKLALAVGGAELLDVRAGRRKNERVVRYRLEKRRFECVCTTDMHVVDAGICLVDHHSGEKGDTYFTLESIPAVIRQAIREHKLVVFRHV